MGRTITIPAPTCTRSSSFSKASGWWYGRRNSPRPERSSSLPDKEKIMNQENSRRRSLKAAGAAGAAALLPGCAGMRESSGARLIDTHHHFYAPAYQKAWLDWEDERKIPHFQTQVNWSRARALEDMDKAGVRTAVLSLASTPGVWFDLTAAEAARMARTCNDYGAEMVRDYPGRFGLFATLPMLDIDSTLNEIAYSFHALKPRAAALH